MLDLEAKAMRQWSTRVCRHLAIDDADVNA